MTTKRRKSGQPREPEAHPRSPRSGLPEGEPSEPRDAVTDNSVSTETVVPPELMQQALRGGRGESDATVIEAVDASLTTPDDAEMTVNLSGDMLPLPGRDDLDAPTVAIKSDSFEEVDRLILQRKHLRGLLEALVFASDSPIKTNELAKLADAPQKLAKELLGELKQDYQQRGVHLEEVAGGWVFRTSAQYAPFIRDLTKQRPVRLTRAQVETLAIIAYRQPITRPEVDDVRGVDSGPVLKLLLERDLVRILGKRDEPGRPLIYGTTTHFLEFFGLKSLKDLPTLREFTELSEESREKYEEELGEASNDAPPMTDEEIAAGARRGEGDVNAPRESMAVPAGEIPADDIPGHDLEPVSALFDDDEKPRDEGDASRDERVEDGHTLRTDAPKVGRRDDEDD